MIYNFTFEDRDAQLIVEALTKMPYYQVNELIGNIQAQATQQNNCAQQPQEQVKSSTSVE